MSIKDGYGHERVCSSLDWPIDGLICLYSWSCHFLRYFSTTMGLADPGIRYPFTTPDPGLEDCSDTPVSRQLCSSLSSLGSLVIDCTQWERATAVTDGAEVWCDRRSTASLHFKPVPEIRLSTMVELLLTGQCRRTRRRRYPRHSTGRQWP